jgi:outer membrane receptor protein involved in Fe transport
MPELLKRRLLASGAAVAVLAFATGTFAQQRAFDIPAEEATKAVPEFARQAGIQVIAPGEQLSGVQTHAVKGQQDARAALAAMLTGTGLEIVSDDGATIVLRRARVSETPSDGAQNDPAKAWKQGQSVAEVVVTAEKRSARVMDVPAPVTVVETATLAETNQVMLKDYFSSIPGLNLQSGGEPGEAISIRGITAGGGGPPSVGVYVDGAPFGPSTYYGQLFGVPEIDPSELQRIEVLNGPQGTLYGADSLGGLIKYVTIDPSTDRFSGRVQVDASSVSHGYGPGYGLQLAANVPVNDRFAIRVSGYDHHFPAYEDNPSLNQRGINTINSYGGRLAAIWYPAQDWSVKFSAINQNFRQDAPNQFIVPFSDPQDNRSTTSVFPNRPQSYLIQSYVSTIEGQLPGVKLAAVTSYSVANTRSTYDPNWIPGQSAVAQATYHLPAQYQDTLTNTGKFTEEARLSGSLFSRLDWLGGAFYTHEDVSTVTAVTARNNGSSVSSGLIYNDSYPTTFSEEALFGDLTAHLTHKLDVQFGVRVATNQQTFAEDAIGPTPAISLASLGTTDFLQPKTTTHDTSTTFLVTPSYKLADGMMLYARVASGFRPGGPIADCTINATPCSYGPDTTLSYEGGAKIDTLGHRLFLTGSIYSIVWNNIQVNYQRPTDFVIYVVNAGAAKSEGVELTAEARPTSNLTLSGWVSYDNAVFTSKAPKGGPPEVPGDRVPYVPYYSAQLAMEYKHYISSGLTGYVGGDVEYVGRREAGLAAIGRLSVPEYTQLKLHAGLTWSNTRLNVYVNNATDARALLYAGLHTPGTYNNTYVDPRTVGVALIQKF